MSAGMTWCAMLHAENIRARRYFFPGCHRMPPYRDLYPEAGASLRETERLANCVLCLPTGETLTADDVAAICGIVRLAVSHSGELRAILSSETQWLNRPDDEAR